MRLERSAADLSVKITIEDNSEVKFSTCVPRYPNKNGKVYGVRVTNSIYFTPEEAKAVGNALVKIGDHLVLSKEVSSG